jgi:predicted AlkP superfamily phosphohydrolase/phosphomutase
MGRDVSADRPRLVIIGLDSVSPDLLYRRFAPVTPRLQQLLSVSASGTLKSCDPPITVPAWGVMFSGVDPGTLGLYGFRHRHAGSYDKMYIPDSATPLRPMAWNVLSRLGRRVSVMGMPPGFPPPNLNGVAVGDFMTPEGSAGWVTPASLRPELEKVSGGPFFDVTFRIDDRATVAREILEMTQRRWKVARHLWQKEPWDLFVVHDIGPDRVHHAFWKYFDTTHPKHPKGSDLEGFATQFYGLLDREVGSFLDGLGSDVRVLVVSDHGSQPMEGCFCINEWLIRKGYLALKTPAPAAGIPLDRADIDWSRTQVWGAGGYYARLFLNERGREPQGTVAPSERAALVERLRADLNEVRTPTGEPLGVRLFSPSEAYREVHGDPPDLMAYFGETRWRSAGSVGHGRMFLDENDTGPDDAVHSFDGIIAYFDPAHPGRRDLGVQQILDVAPTLYRLLQAPAPEWLQGRPIAAIA